ncbi:MAG: bifunctional oligoribonuclease/PAP phosphatase NrnA, partial [Muribaculaceae bacterium]|nr:bifunctional oligoribonuclease/PAP phosphatase NrnA [Muribaculaceae bacterium]
ESDVIRVSMRSVGDFSVQQICTEYFGGGGHLNAAGGEFYGSLEDAAALLRSILPEIKKKNPKK